MLRHFTLKTFKKIKDYKRIPKFPLYACLKHFKNKNIVDGHLTRYIHKFDMFRVTFRDWYLKVRSNS